MLANRKLLSHCRFRTDDLAGASMHHAVMISSTYSDLKRMRQVLIDAAIKAGFYPKVMEYNDGAVNASALTNSLAMVNDSHAYVLLIGRRYGQRPASPSNPQNLSITELEFNEAIRLKKPVKLILLSDTYPTGVGDQLQTDIESLKAFRQRAKTLDGNAGEHRIYKVVNTKQELSDAARDAMRDLADYLRMQPKRPVAMPTPASAETPSDPSAIAQFESAVRILFGAEGPLHSWKRIERAKAPSVLPASVQMALTNPDRGLGDRLSRIVRHELTGALADDLRTYRFTLSPKGRVEVHMCLVDCMDAAIKLCMDPVKRGALQQMRQGLLHVPAQMIPGSALALRLRPLDGLELKPNSPNRALSAKHVAEFGLEVGLGDDANFSLASLVCSIPSSRNPEGRVISINSERDVEEWRGFLLDERGQGRERLLVLALEFGNALGDTAIAWLDKFGVKTVLLAGDTGGTFWWLEESVLVGRVSGFIEDANAILGDAIQGAKLQGAL